jgi:hypothetical protein
MATLLAMTSHQISAMGGSHEVSIYVQLLSHIFRHTWIPFSFCYEAKEKRIIFQLDTVHLWKTVFKTLTNVYSLSTEMPVFEKVTYWDLLKGSTRELVYDDIESAPRDKVLAAARRYISLRSK